MCFNHRRHRHAAIFLGLLLSTICFSDILQKNKRNPVDIFFYLHTFMLGGTYRKQSSSSSSRRPLRAIRNDPSLASLARAARTLDDSEVDLRKHGDNSASTLHNHGKSRYPSAGLRMNHSGRSSSAQGRLHTASHGYRTRFDTASSEDIPSGASSEHGLSSHHHHNELWRFFTVPVMAKHFFSGGSAPSATSCRLIFFF